MDKNQKHSLLSQLAQTQGDVAQKALEKEADKIAAALQEETNYNTIEQQIELLDAFAYRVYAKAFAITQSLLKRIPQITLTYDTLEGFPEERLRELHKPNSLIIRVLALLKNIRYHMPDEILRTFLEYTIHDDETVSKEAFSGLKAYAEYNLDIFYGDGKSWGGLGPKPQQEVIALLESLTPEERIKYFDGVIVLCDCLLEPSITGTTSTYAKMTFRTGAVPALLEIREVRERSITYLDNLYAATETPEQKRKIISTLRSATQFSHSGRYGEDVKQMLFGNTVAVLKFYQRIVAAEDDMEIVQHIEHLTYWLHHNRDDADISTEALAVKALIDEKQEYQIFKVLIGFEGVFKPWRTLSQDAAEEDKKWENEYRQIEEIRNSKVEEFSGAVTKDNFEEWVCRILAYAKIESNDMATFPFFARFLEKLSRKSPDLAIRLLEDHRSELERFLPCFFFGLLDTSVAAKLRNMMLAWINSGQHLASIARVFEFRKDLDVELLQEILQKAKQEKDKKEIAIPALRQIIAAIAANYEENRKPLINSVFLDAVRTLTELNDAGGLLNIWFRKEVAKIVADMEAPVFEAVLENLGSAKRIDYQAEQILTCIAERMPEKVLDFFGKRLASKEEENFGSGYDAVPFEFHTLQQPLSRIPEQAVDIVSGWYDGEYGLFIYRGAKLLSNIFPDFPDQFKNKLLRLVRSGNREKQMAVMAILRNYEGSPTTHEVCKELVKSFDANSRELDEVSVILESTGVVHGEYGFVEAYQRKQEEITPWLSDSDERVRTFAQQYITRLSAQIDWAKKRADEEIELRKFKYGTDEDTQGA